MKKFFEEPTLEVIKFAMNENITADEDTWIPTLSPSVEDWD
jgi:hypothetical protein